MVKYFNRSAKHAEICRQKTWGLCYSNKKNNVQLLIPLLKVLLLHMQIKVILSQLLGQTAMHYRVTSGPRTRSSGAHSLIIPPF